MRAENDLFLNITLLHGENMKICVSAAQGSLTAPVDPRFGRCAYLVIVEVEDMTFEALPNVSAGAMHGAGVQTAQMVANRGVSVVITGNVGPNAYEVLSSAGIKIITGATGTVREVVDRYKSGQLQADAKTPNVSAHFGMGGGMGFGRGMGRRGMRAFVAAGYMSTRPMPAASWQPSDYSYQTQVYQRPIPSLNNPTPEEELADLEEYKKRLGNELESLEARIRELKDRVQKRCEDRPQ
jgi:predicted Fe-Mo cluster-binding NifX family protein